MLVPRRFIGLVCALLLSVWMSAAQDDLTDTLYTENDITVSVTHPTDWVSEINEEGLFLANTEEALSTLMSGSGELARGLIGYIVYAPSLVDTLDLPEDADNVAALEALIAVRGLPEFSTGTVYDGSPAVVFYQKPEFVGASTDIFGYDFDGTIIFVAMVNTDVDYEITQGVLDSVALTNVAGEQGDGSDAETGGDEPREVVLSIPTVDDETLSYTLTVELPAGWQELYEEETGAILLASSEAALEIASTGEGEYERGETVIVVGLPDLLTSLEIDPMGSVDAVVSELGIALGVDAFPALLEGYDVPVAQASILSEDMINGGADIYAFGFEDGLLIAVVQPNDGSGASGVNDILRSLKLTIDPTEEE